VQAMISPLRPRTADLASRRARPRESNETALRFVPHSPVSRGKEKNPGSAFAWPGGGWLRTPLPWHSPDLISLPVWLASPVLD